jgi:hypothetical protein
MGGGMLGYFDGDLAGSISGGLEFGQGSGLGEF